MNYFDMIIIVILLLAAARGYHKGLLNAVTGFIGLLCGFLIAFAFAKPVARMLDGHYGIAGKIGAWTVDKFPGVVEMVSPAADNMLSDVYRSVLVAVSGASMQGTLAEVLQHLGMAVWVAFVFLGLLIISGILLRLIAFAVTKGIKNTILGTLNRLGGMAVSAVTAAAGLGLLLVVLTPVLSVSAALPGGGGLGFLNGAVDNSILAPKLMFLYRFLINRIFLG